VKPWPKFLLTTALIAAILACGISRANPIRDWNIRGPISFGQDVSDPGVVAKGLAQFPHFRDTLHWITGPWVAGWFCKFYRPLTSYAWWFEVQAWGFNYVGHFQAVHAVLHLAVLLVAFGFLSYLLGDQLRAAAAVIFFALCFTANWGLPTPSFALMAWHDDPEMWNALCYIGACWCWVAYLRSERRAHLISAVALFILNLGFKEMGYSLPFMIVALAWYEGQLQERWRDALIFFGIAVAAFTYRTWALQGLGFRFGTNGAWLGRLLTNVGGLPFAITNGNYIVPAVLCWVYAAIALRRRWLLGAGLLVAGAALTELTARSLGVGFADGLAMIIDDTQVLNQAIMAVLLWLLWRMLHDRKRAQVMAWLWVAVTYLPLTTAPITAHALYIIALGWAWWLALAMWDAASDIIVWTRANMRLSSPQALSPEATGSR
jgi:hypothetical protein